MSLRDFALGHLLSNDGLVLVFHLVKVVSLQVIEQDSEAAHKLCLLLDTCASVPRQVHLIANPVDLFVIKLDATTFL